MGSTPPITFGGLSSNLPVNDIITKLMDVERRPITLMQQQKQKLSAESAQYDVSRTRLVTLQGSIKKLAVSSILESDPFQSKTATSSDTSAVSVSVGDSATPQTVTLKVNSLATATKATSQNQIGRLLTGSNLLSDVSQRTIRSGNFTVYVNGTANTIAVNDSDTFDDVLGRIDAISGIDSATVDGTGKLNLAFANGTQVKLGSNADTSNFLSVAYLDTGVATSTSITSSNATNTLNLSADISDNSAARLQTAVTAGSTFKIGTASFDTSGKSIIDLLDEINSATEANVVAVYNTAANKLELTNKTTGSTNIYLEDTSGNFLSAMGLIVGGNSTAGQTLGSNADFLLNGAQFYSTSNTVTESVSGLTGVTLNLTGTNTTAATISIARNNAPLKESAKKFVDDFNKVISFIDQQTDAETGVIRNRSTLVNLRNQLRSLVSKSVSGLSEYNSLPLVGISTGAPNESTSGSASTTLQFTETTFDKALANNREEVEQLFKGSGGIFTQLKSLVDAALFDDPTDVKDGIFAASASSITAKQKNLDDSIKRTEARLTAKEAQLRSQFAMMDKLTSQYQSQGTAISGLAAQLRANR
ncbi:MAG: flagellar filament capping protein FliD [Vampirovibrionales bacterium]|nr:flagellar filament capping protein FliD [Vampirovibrionales bacterium]